MTAPAFGRMSLARGRGLLAGSTAEFLLGRDLAVAGFVSTFAQFRAHAFLLGAELFPNPPRFIGGDFYRQGRIDVIVGAISMRGRHTISDRTGRRKTRPERRCNGDAIEKAEETARFDRRSVAFRKLRRLASVHAALICDPVPQSVDRVVIYRHWIPAFAGMTGRKNIVIPAKAGIQRLLSGPARSSIRSSETACQRSGALLPFTAT